MRALSISLAVVTLLTLPGLAPEPAMAGPDPAEASGVAGLLDGVLAREPEVDPPRSAFSALRVDACTSPGLRCRSGDFRVEHALSLQVVPAFVGTVDVDVMRGNHVQMGVTCSSTGLGFASCAGPSSGVIPPGTYHLEAKARPGTVGSWVMMVNYS